MRAITRRQADALVWIAAYRLAHDYPPSLREVASALRINISSTFRLIEALRDKGYLESDPPRIPRMLRLTLKGRRWVDALRTGAIV